jgi:membrane protease YdiL (CAAX protease family)
MPWLLVYQLSLVGTRSPVDNAAAAWIRAVLHSLGRGALVAVSLLTCVLLCLLVLRRLREATRDRGVYGGMLAEGLLYGAVLGTVAHALATGFPMARLGGDASARALLPGGVAGVVAGLHQGVRDLGLAVGAGIFEELVFRGLLLGGVFALMRHGLGTDRVSAGLVALLLSSYLFSDYHHWGPTGEPYDPAVFAFRFHAGVALGLVFLTRGLGIAAFAHGFYDVLVLTRAS